MKLKTFLGLVEREARIFCVDSDKKYIGEIDKQHRMLTRGINSTLHMWRKVNSITAIEENHYIVELGDIKQ